MFFHLLRRLVVPAVVVFTLLGVTAALADGQQGTVLAWDRTPAPGEAVWFVARPVAEVPGSYDACSLAQEGTRDEGIDASGSGCP